ncbi:MAG: class I SAM-dependent methyltransferase [Solirubrobacteraceae bacterium]
MVGQKPDVYGTARGPLARLASPLAAGARERRHATLFPRLPDDARIVDVGCGTLGLRALEPARDITGVDRAARPDYPGPFVQADVLKGLPFADGEFDLAYCSSVVEHIDPADRPRFADEVGRVAKAVFVQTPAWSFPVEPHALLPLAHWLPSRIRRPYWRLGAAGDWEDIRLLRRGELAALFPGTEVVAERFGPLAKSWVARTVR